MKNTVLSCLTAAIGAAASASLTAQAATAPAVVEVVGVQDPRPGVDIERQLKQVIELLQSEQLSTTQRDQARRTLEELLERVHEEHSRRAVAKVGSGGVWVATPDGESDVAIVEIDGEPMVGVAPKATVRKRVARLAEVGDGDAHPEARARVLRKRLEQLNEEVDQLRTRTPKAPRAPKPPRAPKAPKAPNQVEWKVLHDDGGSFRVLRDGEPIEGVIEIEVDDDHVHETMDRLLGDEAIGEAKRRRFVKVHGAGGVEGRDSKAADGAAGQWLQLVREHLGAGDAQKAHTEMKVLLEREAAADAVKARATKQRKGMVLELDDVTDEHDLHEMLDEMRAEMREIRELMQKIRSQAKADQDSGVGASVGGGLRFMKQ